MSKVGNTVTETYARNGQQNVTKHTSANHFELTIPPDSVKLSCPGFPVREGTKSAGSHGWWALVTLDSGPHKISYNTIVSTNDLPPDSETSPGTPFTSAVITYSLKVV